MVGAEAAERGVLAHQQSSFSNKTEINIILKQKKAVALTRRRILKPYKLKHMLYENVVGE